MLSTSSRLFPLRSAPLRIAPSVSKRYASIVITPSDPKLATLLKRLEDFNNDTQIFDKLDELHLLAQRKGFFNLNSNNLQFLSNNSKITNQYNNLQNFNNLDKLFNNGAQTQSIFKIPPSVLLKGSEDAKVPLSGTQANSSIITPSINSNSLTNGSMDLLTRGSFSFNSEINKFTDLLANLAKNDSELQNKVKDVLFTFEKVDDFFFAYVLEFWLGSKNFSKLKQHQNKSSKPHLKSSFSL